MTFIFAIYSTSQSFKNSYVTSRTGKSLLEALILVSTNPQYDFIDLPVQ